MANRVNIVNVLIGGRGTGKTYTILHDVIAKYQEAAPDKKILVIDTFNSPAYEGIENITIPDMKRWVGGCRRYLISCVPEEFDDSIDKIAKYCYNSVIIIEDSGRFITSSLRNSILRLVTDTKQKNIDLYFVFHSLMQVPPRLIQLTDFVLLHKTNEKLTTALLNKYPNPELHEAFKRVNKHKNKYYYEILRIN